MTFDLTYNIIREHSIPSQFAVGIFCGLTNALQLTVFGVAICSQESKECFVDLFGQFFTLMGRKPLSIFTDNQKTLSYALQ